MTSTTPGTTPIGTRLLGVVGVLGGLVLLAAFVVGIPDGWNPARLVLFNAGAIAVAVAVHARHAAVSRRLALAGTIAVLVANASAIAWTMLAIDRISPFTGTFGLVGFSVGLGTWLADALFGVVALRLGVLWRWAALALLIGSLLAISGMDRLALTSSANPTVFGPISLAGIALNGIAWVALGLEVAVPVIRHRRSVAIIPGAGGIA